MDIIAGQAREDAIVKHTWLDDGKLGFNLMSRARGGVIVSLVKDEGLPIKQGHQLESINGTNVAAEPVHNILKMLEGAGRPLTVEFRETVEHRVLSQLFERFMLADKDGSGALDRDEVADVVRWVYRTQRMSRATNKRLSRSRRRGHCPVAFNTV